MATLRMTCTTLSPMLGTNPIPTKTIAAGTRWARWLNTLCRTSVSSQVTLVRAVNVRTIFRRMRFATKSTTIMPSSSTTMPTTVGNDECMSARLSSIVFQCAETKQGGC